MPNPNPSLRKYHSDQVGQSSSIINKNDQKITSKLNDESNEIGLTRQDLIVEYEGVIERQQEEIMDLKEKAHQSFLQVLQIQELHQEEISQLKDAHSQKEGKLRSENSHLQEELSRMGVKFKLLEQNMQTVIKNANHNNLQLQKAISLDGVIDPISYSAESSGLDDSILSNFQYLTKQVSQSDQKGADVYDKILQGLEKIGNLSKEKSFNSNAGKQKTVIMAIKQITHLVNSLNQERNTLFEQNQNLKKQNARFKDSNQSLEHEINNVRQEKQDLLQKLKEFSLEKVKLQKRSLEDNNASRCIRSKNSKVNAHHSARNRLKTNKLGSVQELPEDRSNDSFSLTDIIKEVKKEQMKSSVIYNRPLDFQKKKTQLKSEPNNPKQIVKRRSPFGKQVLLHTHIVKDAPKQSQLSDPFRKIAK